VFQINIVELMMINNPLIIDIRSVYSYGLGHINGAISVPYYNLLSNYSHYLNRYNKYYLYCDTGEQSLEIATRLQRFGYDTFSVIGGYQEYLRFIGG
jgi:rhodanese-related sulfurtransferase